MIMDTRTFVILVLSTVCDCQSNWLKEFRSIFRYRYGETVNDEIQMEYDFIVVGAGSGGSVVANRLTENPEWTVLLLEAGEEENFFTDVPLIAALQSVTAYNWNYHAQKLHTACLGLNYGRCSITRGKALGGTSVINFMIYTRGNRFDYDTWAELGSKGWSYKDVLPYFIKSENCSLCQGIDRSYHGMNGYLNIEHPGYESPFVKLFLKAGEDMGYKVGDINGRAGLGFSKVQATIKHGRRCSAAKAFLQPIQYRQNLHISKGSRVTKILINPSTKRAYGVEFWKNKRRYKVIAKKEVILSAGAINSPHLLMLSGVGPSKDLKRVKIPVLQDLKVGYNFQDHVAMSTLVFLVNQSVTVSDLTVQNPTDLYNYLVEGKGPYTIPGGAEALAFVKTKLAPNSTHDYPDIELVLGAGALNGDIFGSFRKLLEIPDDLFQHVYGPIIGLPAFGIALVLMRPKSRGRVTLKDSNPFHWPLIYPNYYENEEDVATMVEGIKMAISIANSSHFQRYNTHLNPNPFPQCSHLVVGSDSYWACAIRHVSTSLGHHVGTCKMGPSDDPDAVVDPRLRVYGITGLRVVDGSVMPNIVAGHTNGPIFMIGERAADFIKEEWMRTT